MRPSIITRSVIFLLATYTLFLSGQSNIIKFENGEFKAKEELPYGQIILLQGKSKSQVEKVEVECIVLTDVKSYTVERSSENTWEAKIGPFPLRTDIIVTIREKRKLSNEEKTEIALKFNNYIEELKELGSFDEPTAKKLLIKNLDGLNYKTSTGKRADSVLADKIDLSIVNKLNEAKKLSQSNFVKVVKQTQENDILNAIDKKTDEELYNWLAEQKNNDLLSIMAKQAIDETAGQALINQFRASYSRYNEGLTDLNKIQEEFTTETVISESARSSFDVSGLQAYVDVDLGLIRSDTVTSFFVTLYPYLKKTDPDKDYNLKEHCLLHFITPAFGIGVGKDIEVIKPVYFVGVGFRLNKVFRIATGATYFKPKKETSDCWNFGFSASVNINYVADLFRMITAAQSNVK